MKSKLLGWTIASLVVGLLWLLFPATTMAGGCSTDGPAYYSDPKCQQAQTQSESLNCGSGGYAYYSCNGPAGGGFGTWNYCYGCNAIGSGTVCECGEDANGVCKACGGGGGGTSCASGTSLKCGARTPAYASCVGAAGYACPFPNKRYYIWDDTTDNSNKCVNKYPTIGGSGPDACQTNCACCTASATYVDGVGCVAPPPPSPTPPPPPACTDEGPTAPTLSSPANGASLSSTSVNLLWNSPTSWGTDCPGPNVDQFRVYVGTSNPPHTVLDRC